MWNNHRLNINPTTCSMSIFSCLVKHKMRQNISMIFYFSILVSLVSFQGIAHANSLEEVDDKELNKLLNQEQYVAVLFSKLHIFEIYLQLKCKELYTHSCIVTFPSSIILIWWLYNSRWRKKRRVNRGIWNRPRCSTGRSGGFTKRVGCQGNKQWRIKKVL